MTQVVALRRLLLMRIGAGRTSSDEVNRAIEACVEILSVPQRTELMRRLIR